MVNFNKLCLVTWVCSIILHILSRCRNKQGSKYLVGSSNFVVYNGLKQFLKYCLFAFRWDICSTFVLILKSLIHKIDAFFVLHQFYNIYSLQICLKERDWSSRSSHGLLYIIYKEVHGQANNLRNILATVLL